MFRPYRVFYHRAEAASLIDPGCLGVVLAKSAALAQARARERLNLRFPESELSVVPVERCTWTRILW